jgi:predicted dehydrogenase
MIRIGIIGTDVVAGLHTGALLTTGNFEIAGCYAPDNRDSMVFARHYRLVSYSSMEALFKYTDAIDIAGYFPEMTNLAEKSVKNHKHVYIAQPHHLGTVELQYLTKLADEAGTALQFGGGYRHYSVYNALAELKQKPRKVEIRHQLSCSETDLFTQLNTELARDIDFVLGTIHANISKIDLKSWCKTEDGYADMLECRLDCDNGCVINVVMHATPESASKLELVYDCSDLVVNADVFKSVIEKQYCDYDVLDSIVLDAYNEKTAHKNDLINFYRAIANDTDAAHRLEEQLQSIAVTDLIIERIKQLQPIQAMN